MTLNWFDWFVWLTFKQLLIKVNFNLISLLWTEFADELALQIKIGCTWKNKIKFPPLFILPFFDLSTFLLKNEWLFLLFDLFLNFKLTWWAYFWVLLLYEPAFVIFLLNQLCMTSLFTKRERSQSSFLKSMLLPNFAFNVIYTGN